MKSEKILALEREFEEKPSEELIRLHDRSALQALGGGWGDYREALRNVMLRRMNRGARWKKQQEQRKRIRKFSKRITAHLLPHKSLKERN